MGLSLKTLYKVVLVNTSSGGGRVVRVADFKSLAPHRCCVGSILGQCSQNLSCQEAIKLAYGRSVVLPRCTLVHE